MMAFTYGGQNVPMKNLTNHRYEPPCIKVNYPVKWSDNLKRQHFKFGQAAGASTGNRLCYGSVAEDTTSRLFNTAPTKLSKYYTQPATETLPYYSKKDFTRAQQGNQGVANMFSLEERSSAEIKKKAKEAKDVGDERARYLEEKKFNEMAKLKEKKEELNMLMAYKEPWGKPGAGAPKSTNVRTNAVKQLTESGEHLLPLGKPGAGAPLRTDSGKLKTKTSVDPEIRFQKRERGQVYDIVGPDPKYAQENSLVTNLDLLAKKTREERKVVKREDADGNSFQVYDPFGKPGCGAPTKDRNGNVIATRTYNLVRTVQETDPREENTKFKNRPRWDRYLKKQTFNNEKERYMDKMKQKSYYEELGEITRQKTETRQNDILKEREASVKHADTWNNLWGRPGNGAPLGNSPRNRPVNLFDGQRDSNKLLV